MADKHDAPNPDSREEAVRRAEEPLDDISRPDRRLPTNLAESDAINMARRRQWALTLRQSAPRLRDGKNESASGRFREDEKS